MALDLARCLTVDRAAIRSEGRARDDRTRRTGRDEVGTSTSVARRDTIRRLPRGRRSRGAREARLPPARCKSPSSVQSARADLAHDRARGKRRRSREGRGTDPTIAEGSFARRTLTRVSARVVVRRARAPATPTSKTRRPAPFSNRGAVFWRQSGIPSGKQSRKKYCTNLHA